MMPRSFCVACLTALLTCCFAPGAQAYNAAPGSWGLTVHLGPSFRLDSDLGGPNVWPTLAITSDYALTKRTSFLVSLLESPGESSVTRARAGVRLRWPDLGLALSPYIQAEGGATGLFGVLGSNLLGWGARLGAGVDYIFGHHLMMGIATDVDLGATAGDNPAFFGLYEVMLHVGTRLP